MNNNNDNAGNGGNFLQKSVVREREEEKRRLQAEMRRREQELLAKIKEQQRELETMKQEKGKVRSMPNFCFNNLKLLLKKQQPCLLSGGTRIASPRANT